MLVEYACCPRCLGDLVVDDQPGSREFACLQCGESGELLHADEYLARRSEQALYRRKASPRRSLTAA